MQQPAVVDDLRRTQRQLDQRLGDDRVVLLPVVDVDLAEVGVILGDERQASTDVGVGRLQDLLGIGRIVAGQDSAARADRGRPLPCCGRS